MELLPHNQEDYLNALTDLGWSEKQVEERRNELTDESDDGKYAHMDALEDFAGFMLSNNRWTKLQHRNYLLDTVGLTKVEIDETYD